MPEQDGFMFIEAMRRFPELTQTRDHDADLGRAIRGRRTVPRLRGLRLFDQADPATRIAGSDSAGVGRGENQQ